MAPGDGVKGLSIRMYSENSTRKSKRPACLFKKSCNIFRSVVTLKKGDHRSFVFAYKFQYKIAAGYEIDGIDHSALWHS